MNQLKTHIITWLRNDKVLYLSGMIGGQTNWSYDIKNALRFSKDNIPNLSIDKFYKVHDLRLLNSNLKEARIQIYMHHKHDQTN
jgi:pantothenate kinase-related protein Tda10